MMSSSVFQQVLRLAAFSALAMVAACSTPPPQLPADPPPVVVDVPTAAPSVAIKPAPKKPEPRLVEPPKEPIEIAIVLSDRQPAYDLVAAELAEQMEHYSIFDLADKSLPPITVFRQIADSGADAVVAIGLRAAVSATSMADVPIIFCQVFNYQDNGLVGNNSRGVSSLPPLDLQISAWKKIDPDLQHIGAILGEGHEELIQEAQLAADAHGIELHLRTVKSDRETQYVFNRLVSEIDGFWLFPDNRVLSGAVLHHIVTYAARRKVQVAVFNESLLQLGATLSASAVEADIAGTIAGLVEQIEEGNFSDMPALTQLSDVRIVTNDDVLQQIKVARENGPGETTAQITN